MKRGKLTTKDERQKSVPQAQPAPGVSSLAEPSVASADRGKALTEAWSAHHLAIPAALREIVGNAGLGVLGAKFYLETVRFEAGKPSDPVERMLLDQLTLAHHRLGVLARLGRP